MLNNVKGVDLIRKSEKRNALKGKLQILQNMAVKNRLPWKRQC